MTLLEAAHAYIPPPDWKNTVLYNDGDTKDIMHEVMDCINDTKDQLQLFAPFLKGATIEESCKNIWRFVKQNIRYTIDPEGVQWANTPARAWARRKVGVDCKSYTIFIAALLHSLGIKGTVRFVSFSKTKPLPTHVYVVVHTLSQTIVIDDVLKKFNTEKAYQYKYDYSMTQISRLSGIGNTATAAPAKVEHFPLGAYALKRRLLAERKMLLNVSGIGNTAAAAYDKWIDELDEAIRNPQQHVQVGSLFKKIGKGVAKLGKNIIKVATTPIRLAIKPAIKDAIPKSAMGFVYLYFPDNVVSSLPANVQKKRKKQFKLKTFITEVIGMKNEDFHNLVWAGFLEKYGETPHAYLSRQFNITISGIGFAELAAAEGVIKVIVDLINQIVSIFKKKPDVTAAELVPDASDWEGWKPAPGLAAKVKNDPSGKTLLEKAGVLIKKVSSAVKNLKPQQKQAANVVDDGGGTSAAPEAPPPTQEKGDNTMLWWGVGLVGAFLLLKK